MHPSSRLPRMMMMKQPCLSFLRRSVPLSSLKSPRKSLPRLKPKSIRESVVVAVAVEVAEATVRASTVAEAVEESVVVAGIDAAVRMPLKVKRASPKSRDLLELVAVMLRENTVAVAVVEPAEVKVKRESTGDVVAIEVAAETVRVSTAVEAATEVVAMEDLAVAATTMVKTKMASRKSEPERTDNAVVVVAEAREVAASEEVKEAVAAEVALRVMKATSRDAAGEREVLVALAAATEVVLKARSQL